MKVVMYEIALVMSVLKPAIDAHRVAQGNFHEENAMVVWSKDAFEKGLFG